MQQIDKLNRKLNFWPSIKKKLVTAGLIAALLVPIAIASIPALITWNKRATEVQRLESLCGKPVDAEIVAPIRAEALEDVISDPDEFSAARPMAYHLTGKYKEYENLIQSAHEKTSIPKYIFAAFIEDGFVRNRGMDAMQYTWVGIIDLNEDEAGLTPQTLWQDQEQCLMSKGGEYHKIFSSVQDEIVALALLFNDEKNLVKAKSEAGTCKSLIDQYQEWRYDQHSAGRKPTDKLKQFDALVEKYHILVKNTAILDNLDEKQALEKEIKTLWRSTLPNSDPRGYTRTPNSNTYKVALRPEHYKRKQWCVGILSNSDFIKIALRLKKDGYK